MRHSTAEIMYGCEWIPEMFMMATTSNKLHEMLQWKRELLLQTIEILRSGDQVFLTTGTLCFDLHINVYPA